VVDIISLVGEYVNAVTNSLQKRMMSRGMMIKCVFCEKSFWPDKKVIEEHLKTEHNISLEIDQQIGIVEMTEMSCPKKCDRLDTFYRNIDYVGQPVPDIEYCPYCGSKLKDEELEI
jgi:hypothetical protein